MNINGDYTYAVNMGIGINPNYEQGGKNYLWKNLTIPYEIDDTFVCDSKQRLLAMINEWNDSRMVIKYKPHDGEVDYALFTETANRGGSSHVGCIKDGEEQLIKIDLDVKGNDSILHEMGHAAGLHHEHQRCDRNSYINITNSFANHIYDETDPINDSDVYWVQLAMHYNEQYDPDLNAEKLKEMIQRYGIIPVDNENHKILTNHKKYKIYTCYDYRSIMHYKTQEIEEIIDAKYDTIRSYPEVFGGYNYVEHSPFLPRDDRNDQTARNGLSFNDIYTIWRIYSADCRVPPRRCTYVRPMSFGVTLLPGSVQSNSEF